MNHFEDAVRFCITAHRDHPRMPHNAVRKWDGRTPYSMHPIWCAMTMLTETALDEELRYNGAIALLYHDILEDTTAALPEDTPTAVQELVAQLTFPSTAMEMNEIFSKDKFIILLKLYDKTSNLLDAGWMKAERLAVYQSYTARLLAYVEAAYPEVATRLNIVTIARALLPR